MRNIWLMETSDAIGVIADGCDCTFAKLVDALIGVAFDEEDAGAIMEYHDRENGKEKVAEEVSNA